MMMGMDAVVHHLELVQFGCCAAMTGIIWYVHWVHYPSFLHVDPAQWQSFHARHTGMTGAIVGPLMLGEMVSAAALTWWVPPWGDPAAMIALLLLVVIWGVTAFRSVPCHRRLERGYDAGVVRRLIRDNGFRTGAWTLRSLLLLYGLQVISR
jgi:hypothetical protein